MLLIPDTLHHLPHIGPALASCTWAKPASPTTQLQALIHAIQLSGQQERVRQLQRQIGPIASPRGVVTKAALDEVRPNGVEREAGRAIDIAPSFWPM